MATLEISEPMFAETIENNELVLLDFWAEWCGPCKAYGPVYERVSEEFPEVVFGKIDTEEQQALAGMFGIRSIPTTIAFKEGIGVFMQPGALPEDALRDLIEKLQGLDMNEVRAELEARENARSNNELATECVQDDPCLYSSECGLTGTCDIAESYCAGTKTNNTSCESETNMNNCEAYQ